jgi:DNA polymerase-3 subunit beta
MTTATAPRKRKAGGITLTTSTLKAALADLAPAVPTRAAKPVLTNVLFSDGRIFATDLEIAVGADIDYHGEPLLLPFARLRAIVASATSDEIELAVDGAVCVVTAGRGSWRLPVEDAAEYPVWTPEGVKPLVRLPCDQFARAARGTVYATDTESSRFALGAVLVEVADGVASFVATDGRRLSLVACDHDQAVGDGTALVPARALAALAARAARLGDDAVQLEASDREIVATMPGATFAARLVEGRFPRWRDTLASDRQGERVAVVNREDLLAATRAAAIVTTEESKGVDFAFTRDGIWLHGQSSSAGESSVTVDATYADEPVTVKLDPRFVSQWLSGLTAEDDPNVTIHVVDAESSAVLRCDSCTGVIMPLARG